MHPIFVSITNIQSDVWMRATSHAWRCVNFMPIPKIVNVHADYQTILSQRLFHKCMDIIFADAKVAAMSGKFIPNPSGHQAIACVSKVASPVTLAISHSFGDSYHHAPCTKEHTLSVIYIILYQMKQMTSQEHRDLQCTLVPSIAGVVPPQFVHAICALIDFIYQAQSPFYTDTSIDSMIASLKEFHDHKQAILDARARQGTKGTINNFLIPKLKLLQSFAAFTKDIGTLIQWTADRTSHQSHTFTEQIFQLYLFLWMHNTPLTNAIVTEEQEVTETDPALTWITHVAPHDPNQWCFIGLHPGILSSTATAAFHITMSINKVQQLYALPDFGQALPDYIMKVSDGQFTTTWRCNRGCLKMWNKFCLQLHSAAPPSEKFSLGNCDAVIVQSMHGDQTVNIVAQVQAVFQPLAPPHVTLPHYLTDHPLLYVQYYKIINHPGNQPAISMYMVAQKYREGPTGQQRLGAVIPLTDVMQAVSCYLRVLYESCV
ncbi:hypothetical protein BDR06DRAFT_985748 [Suillus hirtellus]|nr:hypothetical protein BDR06DRAFT_985748 [Suillus hirtellus]